MRYYLLSLLLAFFSFSSCYDTAYNPDYIISDTAREYGDESDEEEP